MSTTTRISIPQLQVLEVIDRQHGKIFAIHTGHTFWLEKYLGRVGGRRKLNKNIPGLPPPEYFRFYLMPEKKWRTIKIKDISYIKADGVA